MHFENLGKTSQILSFYFLSYILHEVGLMIRGDQLLNNYFEKLDVIYFEKWILLTPLGNKITKEMIVLYEL